MQLFGEDIYLWTTVYFKLYTGIPCFKIVVGHFLQKLRKYIEGKGNCNKYIWSSLRYFSHIDV